jgi:hypothetical protein
MFAGVRRKAAIGSLIKSFLVIMKDRKIYKKPDDEGVGAIAAKKANG